MYLIVHAKYTLSMPISGYHISVILRFCQFLAKTTVLLRAEAVGVVLDEGDSEADVDVGRLSLPNGTCELPIVRVEADLERRRRG